jgi:hypothetical protein
MANWNGSRWLRRGSRRTKYVGYQSDVETISSTGGITHRVGPSLEGHGNLVVPPAASDTKRELEVILAQQQSNRKGK